MIEQRLFPGFILDARLVKVQDSFPFLFDLQLALDLSSFFMKDPLERSCTLLFLIGQAFRGLAQTVCVRL